MLYVSYGGFPNGIGHLLEFSLDRRKIVYDRGYPFGIDSLDISQDGRLIFMPTGENTSGDTWHVLAATTGQVVGAIAAGRSQHDTVVGASGQHVFLGGASDHYLYEADSQAPVEDRRQDRTAPTRWASWRQAVGNAGNVIDTATRKTVATIAALAGSRYDIEVDWSGAGVRAAYPRESLGYLQIVRHCSARTG